MNDVLPPLPVLPFYTLRYEPDPPLLYGLNQRMLSAEEITETCELLLATARRLHCTSWLLDGRAHQREQPQSLHDWMREEYFPRVRKVLGTAPNVAFLVPPHIWAGLPAKGYTDPTDWLSRAARIAWFTEEAPAREWLQRLAGQRPVPA